jgi:hypothetical protein
MIIMKLELDVYSAVCETSVFKINGINAKYEDFGEKFDACPCDTKPLCCGNMVFKPKGNTGRVLQKYGITADEYTYICVQLRKKLSFGLCRYCA